MLKRLFAAACGVVAVLMVSNLLVTTPFQQCVRAHYRAYDNQVTKMEDTVIRAYCGYPQAVREKWTDAEVIEHLGDDYAAILQKGVR